ncbi:hypothetical protein MJT46_018180 [Ovis ammon polii x Ovis aries]|nr:hypothetical protein MJT46_018180 [Ovis ammon polii x Ovis aries]
MASQVGTGQHRTRAWVCGRSSGVLGSLRAVGGPPGPVSSGIAVSLLRVGPQRARAPTDSSKCPSLFPPGSEVPGCAGWMRQPSGGSSQKGCRKCRRSPGVQAPVRFYPDISSTPGTAPQGTAAQRRRRRKRGSAGRKGPTASCLGFPFGAPGMQKAPEARSAHEQQGPDRALEPNDARLLLYTLSLRSPETLTLLGVGQTANGPPRGKAAAWQHLSGSHLFL